MELAFAGLHQLCVPMLHRWERLPSPQRDALGIAFGLSAGHPAERFLLGLAVLSLLSDMADGRPLVCLVDDWQGSLTSALAVSVMTMREPFSTR